jgi:cytochrome c5
MRTGITFIAATLLAQSAALADDGVYRHFDGQHLAEGRVVWLANCEGCHGYGIAGAPIPMEPDAWRHRLRQDRTTLHRHAIEGFFGPDGTMMPPRGGNDSLTDNQVRVAVDYMATLAEYYLQPTEQAQ